MKEREVKESGRLGAGGSGNKRKNRKIKERQKIHP
jgi:hypothetical protein